ncbi:MAG: NADPH:quinone reductase [Kribbellaceae bacterium]|nr:NADPH:quinone reductase [Kribbellaceae bacterium]
MGGFNIDDLARRGPEFVRRFGQAALELVASGQVRIDVSEVLRLADAKVTLDRLAGGTNRGKLVLTTT